MELENRELRLSYSRPERTSSMNNNSRRYFSPEQKVAILREHLIEGKAVSDLCDKHHIHATVFYQCRDNFSRTEQLLLKASSPVPVFLMGIKRRLNLWSRNSSAKTRCFQSCWREHTRLKKNLGRADCFLGGTRCSRRDHGLHRTLVRTHREPRSAAHAR